MGFKDLAGQAGEFLGQHDEQVDSAVDQAAKGRFAGHDGMIDGLADKAKAYEFGPGAPGEPPPSGEAPLAEAPPAGDTPEAEQPPAE